MGLENAGETTLPGEVAEDDNALPTVVNARTAAMQAIEQDNLRRMEAETGMKLVEDEPQDDQLSKQLNDPAPEPEPEPSPEPAPAPAPELVRVKVDGQEMDVSMDDLIRTFQKNQAADSRLARATQILQESEQFRAQLIAAPVATPEPEAIPQRDAVRSQVEAAVTKLFEGEQDAAVEALTELIAKAGGPSPTPSPVPQLDVDAVADQVQERVAIRAAFNTVKTDYPDLVSNPTLERLAGMQIDELEAQGIPRSQAILSVADQLYRDLGKTPVGRQAPAPVEQPKPNARQEAKQKLDNVQSASGAASVPTVPEEPNPSDIIAQMAARRLGQSMPRQTG